MMARCRICGSGVAARCEGCVAEMEDRLVCKIELLRHEVNYLRMRCAEQGVKVAWAWDLPLHLGERQWTRPT